MAYTIPDFGPSDLLTSDVEGVRRVKTDMFDIVETASDGSKGLPVYINDQFTSLLPVPMLQERASVTLASNAVVNSRVVNLSSGHGSVVGEVLELAEIGTPIYMQAKIVAVNADAITIDQPVNYPYTVTNSIAVRSSDDMLVNGSVTPQIFSILPLPGQSGDMVRMIVTIEGTSPMDFTTFGSEPALINGCVLRIKHGNVYKNIFNFKTNSDIIKQGFDNEFLSNTGNSARGFVGRITWGGQSKQGVVIRLNGDAGDELQLVIQDNLNNGDNTKFNIMVQGHEIQSV